MSSKFCPRLLAIGLVLAAVAGPAAAQETTTYQYDVHGRVTNVSRSGGPSSGVTAGYQYDAADNRTNVTVTGSPNGSGNGSGDGASVSQRKFVVVPLNGYSLIFIN
jgi:YD repeat-containing protein